MEIDGKIINQEQNEMTELTEFVFSEERLFYFFFKIHQNLK